MRRLRGLRRDLRTIWRSALESVDPEEAVRQHVRRKKALLTVGGRIYDLEALGRLWVIGAGKAAAPMAAALEKILSRRIEGGIVVTKYGHGLPLRRIEVLEAGHPLPDDNGTAAADRIEAFIQSNVAPEDLVFCLLSGGGSSLWVAPAPGIHLDDKVQSTRHLLKCGATIQEINAIRKHLSRIKGGQLAASLYPASVASLILSDVVGDELHSIASGPLVPDPTHFGECLQILRRLDILQDMPDRVRRRLRLGARGKIQETPKRDDPVFQNVHNVIVASNAQACGAAANRAKQLGYRAMVLSSRVDGDTSECAGFHMNIIEEIVSEGRPLSQPACLISGGETTVVVRGKGKGGRNQEFTLRCVAPLAQLSVPCALASIGTDGSDGPTDAAGAVADNFSLRRATGKGIGLQRCLENNDSYSFFEPIGDLVMTGPTRTNVMDLRIALIG